MCRGGGPAIGLLTRPMNVPTGPGVTLAACPSGAPANRLWAEFRCALIVAERP